MLEEKYGIFHEISILSTVLTQKIALGTTYIQTWTSY